MDRTQEVTTRLSATSIVKSFGRRGALDGVNLEAHAGEAVALVGENGAGKTTLLRICAGLLAPDGGQVRRSGRVGYCPQQPGLVDLLTADEHLVLFGGALGLGRRTALSTGRAVLESLAFTASGGTVARDLSGGTRQKLNLALALLGDPQLLLLDEPTNHMDMETIESLQIGLEKYPGTLLFVSHDREFVSGLATRIIELRPGGDVVDFKGTYDEYLRSQGVQL